MKATMKNWIDFAAEVREAVNIEIPDGENDAHFDSGQVTIIVLRKNTFSLTYGFHPYSCTVRRYDGNIEDVVGIEFTDSIANPTDFDTLLDEAKAWWNEFKTSDHPILLDNQIRKTLRHENKTTEL